MPLGEPGEDEIELPRLEPRALDVEALSANHFQEGLRHLVAGRVVDAQKQDLGHRQASKQMTCMKRF